MIYIGRIEDQTFQLTSASVDNFPSGEFLESCEKSIGGCLSDGGCGDIERDRVLAVLDETSDLNVDMERSRLKVSAASCWWIKDDSVG